MSFEGTEAQQRAIALHERNLVVLAAAGSGKTHVLVERYLALLAANPDWPLESLVAITFTRKAAHEMRERVRRELQEQRRATSAEAPQPQVVADASGQRRKCPNRAPFTGCAQDSCASALPRPASTRIFDVYWKLTNLVDIELERALRACELAASGCGQ